MSAEKLLQRTKVVGPECWGMVRRLLTEGKSEDAITDAIFQVAGKGRAQRVTSLEQLTDDEFIRALTNPVLIE